mgnify:FL=1
MENIFEDYAFGIILTIGVFIFATGLKKKFNYSIVNPVFISLIIIVAILAIFNIDYQTYYNGGQFINMFLGPATVVLAVPLYKQIESLKKNFIAITPAIIVGSITSIVSVYLISGLFGFDEQIRISLLPKSVTTPIGMAVSEQLGGNTSITVFAIIITGITGALIAPCICRIFKIDDRIAKGVSIGTSSHALGTTKAIEMGQVEGAMSGLSIGISGLITVFLANPILYVFDRVLG